MKISRAVYPALDAGLEMTFIKTYLHGTTESISKTEK